MKKYTELLKKYYHLDNNKFGKSLFWDIILSVLGIGSGLMISFIRGLLFKVLLKYQYPALIGKRLKIINPYYFKAGGHLWLKDDVCFGLGGKIRIGDRCVFCERSTIWSGKGGILIGNDFAMGIGSYLCGSGAPISIGNEVRIADLVRIYTFNHNFDNSNKPFSKQGNSVGDVVIKDNVWIGSGAVILAGVTIGTNSVIAVGAVVTENVRSNTVVAGIPARMINKIL